jgi:hypothetical protein
LGYGANLPKLPHFIPTIKKDKLTNYEKCVTEPMFCYEFRKENGKEERRLRRKEWIFIEEMACSRRLLSCLAF